MTAEGDAAALDTLRAAEIPPERQGVARTRRLSAEQRQLYFWILRRFAAATPPTGAATRAAAEALGLDAAEAFRVLAREDLVHVDATRYVGCPSQYGEVPFHGLAVPGFANGLKWPSTPTPTESFRS